MLFSVIECVGGFIEFLFFEGVIFIWEFICL